MLSVPYQQHKTDRVGSIAPLLNVTVHKTAVTQEAFAINGAIIDKLLKTVYTQLPLTLGRC